MNTPEKSLIERAEAELHAFERVGKQTAADLIAEVKRLEEASNRLNNEYTLMNAHATKMYLERNLANSTITQLRAELADARQIVRNMDQESAMNRELAQKEFDSLRADLAACQNAAIKAAGERDRAKAEVTEWIDCFAIEGYICGDGSQHGPKESVAIWRQRIATLTKECDRAREDSARLDWLEKRSIDAVEFVPGTPAVRHDSGYGPEPGDPSSWAVLNDQKQLSQELTIREAIDSAMKYSSHENVE